MYFYLSYYNFIMPPKKNAKKNDDNEDAGVEKIA